MPFSPAPVHVQTTPANPTAIASAAYLMNGLGSAASPFVITPQITGRVLVIVSGDLVENATAQTATIQGRFGTGTAPANAAADTGTAIGGQVAWTSLTGELTVPFSYQFVITGLSVPSVDAKGVSQAAVAVWIDIASKSSAGTIQLTNLTCVAIEL